MKYCSNHDINRACIELVQQGWRVVNAGRHLKMYPPNSKSMVVVPRSPRGGKCLDAFRGNVKRVLRGG